MTRERRKMDRSMVRTISFLFFYDPGHFPVSHTSANLNNDDDANFNKEKSKRSPREKTTNERRLLIHRQTREDSC